MNRQYECTELIRRLGSMFEELHVLDTVRMDNKYKPFIEAYTKCEYHIQPRKIYCKLVVQGEMPITDNLFTVCVNQYTDNIPHELEIARNLIEVQGIRCVGVKVESLPTQEVIDAISKFSLTYGVAIILEKPSKYFDRRLCRIEENVIPDIPHSLDLAEGKLWYKYETDDRQLISVESELDFMYDVLTCAYRGMVEYSDKGWTTWSSWVDLVSITKSAAIYDWCLTRNFKAFLLQRGWTKVSDILVKEDMCIRENDSRIRMIDIRQARKEPEYVNTAIV